MLYIQKNLVIMLTKLCELVTHVVAKHNSSLLPSFLCQDWAVTGKHFVYATFVSTSF